MREIFTDKSRQCLNALWSFVRALVIMAFWTCLIIWMIFLAHMRTNPANASPMDYNNVGAAGVVIESTSKKQSIDQILKAGAKAARQGNFSHAIDLWSPLADDGNAAAQFGLGLIYKRGNDGAVSADQKRAYSFFEQAGAQGHVRALFQLGVAHERGLGTAKDMKKPFSFIS